MVLTYTTYKCQSLLREYRSNMVKTDLHVEQLTEIHFPQITFCPYSSLLCSYTTLKNNSKYHSHCSKLKMPPFQCFRNRKWSKNCNVEPIVAEKGCFTINPNETATQNRDGISNQFFSAIHHVQKLYMFVHNGSEQATYLSEMYRHLPLTPGVYHIILSKSSINRKPAPYPSKCVGSDHKTLFPGTYTRKKCIESCLLEYTYKKCGSVPDRWEAFVPEHLKEKHNNTNTTRARACLKDVAQYDLLDPKSNCECPSPCHETEYKVNLVRRSDLNYIKLMIYYENRQLTVLREQPTYTSDRLLADVGGLVGLLVGMSTLSLVEVFVFVFLYFKHRYRSKHPKGEKST